MRQSSGVSLTLVSVTCTDPRTVTVVFSAAVTVEGAFSIAPDDPSDTVAVTVLDAEVAGDTVTLTTTEHTDAKAYTLTVPETIYNASGHGLVSDLEQPYTGAGEFPTIALARGVDERKLDVVFSELMLDEDALNPEMYLVYSADDVLSAPIPVLSVEQLGPLEYELTIEPLLDTTDYIVMADGARDIALNRIQSAVEPTATYDDVTVLEELAITPLTPTITNPDAVDIAFTATNLPPGTVIDADTGEITGTPTTPGSYTVTVTLHFFGGTTSDTFVFEVIAEVTIGAIPDLEPEVGVAFSYTPTVDNDSALVLVFTLESGTLPDGLTLDADTGEISGTLTPDGLVDGPYAGLVIRITHDYGTVDSNAFDVLVQGTELTQPVTYYRFDDADVSGATINDLGTAGNHLTAVNAPTSVTGSVDEARQFSAGSNQYARRATTTGINPGAGSFSCVATVKQNSIIGGTSCIFDRYDGADQETGLHLLDNSFVLLYLSSGRPAAFLRDINSNVTSLTDPNLSPHPTGSFFTMGFSADRGANRVALMADGVVLTSAAFASADPITFTRSVLEIANHFDAATLTHLLNLDGVLDEVAYWNVALSDDQLATVEWLRQQGISIKDWVGF